MNNLLDTQGYLLASFLLRDQLKEFILQKDWESIDKEFLKLTAPGGRLFEFLLTFHQFSSIEFIISIRDAQNHWEEDGIWHDDGSRTFAFSLSLTLAPENIEGGKLGIRKKGEKSFVEIPTPHFGEIILFLTGVHGFEHKIHQVTKGQRIVIAGWCS